VHYVVVFEGAVLHWPLLWRRCWMSMRLPKHKLHADAFGLPGTSTSTGWINTHSSLHADSYYGCIYTSGDDVYAKRVFVNYLELFRCYLPWNVNILYWEKTISDLISFCSGVVSFRLCHRTIEDEQVAKLSQRDRAAVWVSCGPYIIIVSGCKEHCCRLLTGSG